MGFPFISVGIEYSVTEKAPHPATQNWDLEREVWGNVGNGLEFHFGTLLEVMKGSCKDCFDCIVIAGDDIVLPEEPHVYRIHIECIKVGIHEGGSIVFPERGHQSIRGIIFGKSSFHAVAVTYPMSRSKFPGQRPLSSGAKTAPSRAASLCWKYRLYWF